MLNWHFLANQFLCPCFSCSFLPVGIPFVPSGILEACSQIPFQASFARLLSLPVCCWKTSSPPHYSSLLPWNGYLFPFQFIFSKKGSVELWLAFLPRSCASETLPASAGNPFLGGHTCIFMATLHLNLQSSHVWLKLSIWWVPTFSVLMTGAEEVFWKCLSALVPFSPLIRHLPPSLTSTAECPDSSLHVCMLL